MNEWRKSTFSDNNGCIELADLGDGVRGIRDSKLGGDSPVLEVSSELLADILAEARTGGLDHLI